MKKIQHTYSNKFLLGEGEGETEHFYTNCGQIIPLKEVVEINLSSEIIQCNECRLSLNSDAR